MSSILDSWMYPDMVNPLLPQLQPQNNWDDYFMKSAPMSMNASTIDNTLDPIDPITSISNSSTNINYGSPFYGLGFSSFTAPTSTEVSLLNSPQLKDEQQDLSMFNMYENLADKLESMQKSKKLTPKLLELIFDTKDILKDEKLNIPKRGKSFLNLSTINEDKREQPSVPQSQVNNRKVYYQNTTTSPQSEMFNCLNVDQTDRISIKQEPSEKIDLNSHTIDDAVEDRLRNSSVSSTNSNNSHTTKKRPPRKRLTELQKQAHNKIEKKYRININTKIAGLQSIIPCLASETTAFETGIPNEENYQAPSNKLNKSMILEKATDYIQLLQEQQRQNALEIQQLKEEINRLRGIA